MHRNIHAPQSTRFGERQSFAGKDHPMPLSLQELKASRSFIFQAHMLVSAVRTLFFGAGDGETAARMNGITTRLDDEREHVERLIAKAAPNGGAAS